MKTEGEARGFQSSRGTLRMLMNDKFMFDRYYCINSTKHCENEENIGSLYHKKKKKKKKKWRIVQSTCDGHSLYILFYRYLRLSGRQFVVQKLMYWC